MTFSLNHLGINISTFAIPLLCLYHCILLVRTFFSAQASVIQMPWMSSVTRKQVSKPLRIKLLSHRSSAYKTIQDFQLRYGSRALLLFSRRFFVQNNHGGGSFCKGLKRREQTFDYIYDGYQDQ